MSILNIGGFDPSMSNFGMVKGLLDSEEGTFVLSAMHLETTSPTKDKSIRKNLQDFERARKLFVAAKAFFEGVDVICVELPVGSQSAAAMKSYGVCIALAAALEMPMIYVTAAEVKIAGAGNKTSSKKEMVSWGTSEYPEAPWLTRKLKGKQEYLDKNEHLADALAAIHAGVITPQFENYIKEH